MRKMDMSLWIRAWRSRKGWPEGFVRGGGSRRGCGLGQAEFALVRKLGILPQSLIKRDFY